VDILGRVADRECIIQPVGVVRSTLTALAGAPRQGSEGAPHAWLEIDASFADAVAGIGAGDQILVLTWLHQADRSVLKTHPRDDLGRPLTGVFATRSPDRPNPIGLHRVTVIAVDGGHRIHVRPLEAIDGTPVVDLKPVVR
jgi:tRNA-Thr(GGU) m(6)t(6)A37 methyltransferase TsaA